MATEKVNNVNKYNTEDDVAVALAKYIADLSAKFIKQKGSFTVVLTGGSLIDTMRYLVEAPYKDSVDWSKWWIFWGDERVVKKNDPESNYNLAWEGFLSKINPPIPSAQIYAINDTLSSPEAAAEDYAARLKQLVESKDSPLSLSGTGFPKFDLILLGMGPDGHVCSLFPTRPQQCEKKRWVTFITDSPKPPPPRITLTFPVINSASEIAMVLTGFELAHIVNVVMCKKWCPGDKPPPAAQVSAEDELTFFLDKDAASEISCICMATN